MYNIREIPYGTTEYKEEKIFPEILFVKFNTEYEKRLDAITLVPIVRELSHYLVPLRMSININNYEDDYVEKQTENLKNRVDQECFKIIKHYKIPTKDQINVPFDVENSQKSLKDRDYPTILLYKYKNNYAKV